jgi:hypothetical protein
MSSHFCQKDAFRRFLVPVSGHRLATNWHQFMPSHKDAA